MESTLHTALQNARVREGIKSEFPKAMEKLGMENERPLSMDTLMAAGLLVFTLPQSTTFVVGREIDGCSYTGFLNNDNHLVGWGLEVYSNGMTVEAVWDGTGDNVEGIERSIGDDSYSVYKVEKDGYVLGKEKTKDYNGLTTYYTVDGKKTTIFSQEAEDFVNKVNACVYSDE